MISIIVTVYNIEKYIGKCIDSIRSQTFSDIEIVLVDDGSVDKSGKICDYYKKKDHRIKVIHKENGGVVSARKSGITASSGKYIGFVDGDDWVEATMYEELYYSMTKHKVQVAMCGRYEDSVDFSKKVFHRVPEGKYNKSEMVRDVYPHMIVGKGFFEWGIFPGYWDKLFERELIERVLMEVDDRLVMGEDAACIFPCLLRADSIYVMHKCLYHYRQTENSMVHNGHQNGEVERQRFRLLYHKTLEVFKEKTFIYDVTKQWMDYILFLMTPRADILYQGIDELDYLFPFPHVKKGERILIYGAGLFGKRLYWYLHNSDFCEVVAIADRDYLRFKKGEMPVISPDRIKDFNYDAIVVASSYQSTRDTIISALKRENMTDRIYGPDIDEIRSEKTLLAFGLLDE